MPEWGNQSEVAMWIRVETNVAENDKIHCFGNFLGISTEEALGFLVRTWGKVAEHRTDGNLEGVLDMTLEAWAGWRGEKGQFATAFRDYFVNGCEITGWEERQGKLIARQAADRTRKFHGKSKEVPRKRRGNSSPTKRNETSKESTKEASAPTADVDTVLTHYSETHPRRKIGDEKQRKIVRKALKLGFSTDHLKHAITGNAVDPWHRNIRKHELSYVLRDADKINEFIDKYDDQQQPADPTGAGIF